jgi:hypothetical protein
MGYVGELNARNSLNYKKKPEDPQPFYPTGLGSSTYYSIMHVISNHAAFRMTPLISVHTSGPALSAWNLGCNSWAIPPSFLGYMGFLSAVRLRYRFSRCAGAKAFDS